MDPIDFDKKAKIVLMEEDSGFLDSDDNLGAFFAREKDLGEDELEHRFEKDGADYLLIYKILDD